MASNSDSDNVYLFRKCDEGEFNRIYAEWEGKLYIYCRRRLEKEDAEDVVAETFALLWRDRAKMESKEHINNYLYQVVRQKSSAVLKKKSQWKMYVCEDDLPDLVKERAELEEIESEIRKLIGMVLEKTDCLPAQCRQAFKYYLANMSVPEIAAVMGISTKSVYAHCASAKERIRTSFKKNGIISIATLGIFIMLITLVRPFFYLVGVIIHRI